MDSQRFTEEKVFKRGRGGSDAEHLADEVLYHELLVRHDEIERLTQKIEDGIEVVTRITSGDPGLVKILQEHVLGIKKRFDGGRAIRSWDPLFIELFDNRKEMNMTWEMLEDGIRTTLTSSTPEVRELIYLHDETLQAFVQHGLKASRHESPYRPGGIKPEVE